MKKLFAVLGIVFAIFLFIQIGNAFVFGPINYEVPEGFPSEITDWEGWFQPIIDNDCIRAGVWEGFNPKDETETLIFIIVVDEPKEEKPPIYIAYCVWTKGGKSLELVDEDFVLGKKASFKLTEQTKEIDWEMFFKRKCIKDSEKT